METPRAEDKLDEARFFLLRMQEASFYIGSPVPFNRYLSAFLSAARSVTFALQKEAKDVYDAWFPKWRKTLSPEESQVLDFMKDQRNREVKELGAKTTRR